ncbi:MAG: deazaflavin-dependent oxidoreductase (nitroreductase family) [Glaciecola sp.]|jgi:deazaflavin-dependent oxidoreductase (nitroreductase family)
MPDIPARPAGLDKPIVVRIIRAMSAANTWLYRKTNGRIGGKWRVMAGFRKPVDVLLLTVTGRSSGLPRTVPLLFLADGDDFVVVASSGGLPDNPQWLRNLMLTPSVHVQVRREHHDMTAHVVDAQERERLWPRLIEVYADFDTYDAWTDRDIPVVRLQAS